MVLKAIGATLALTGCGLAVAGYAVRGEPSTASRLPIMPIARTAQVKQDISKKSQPKLQVAKF